MKKIVLLFISICSITLAYADTLFVAIDTLSSVDTLLVTDTIAEKDTLPPTLLDHMPNAIVWQDSAIVHLIDDRSHGRARGEQEQSGFRVQVYASNEPQVARTTALRLKEELSSVVAVAVYELSDPPFWKVRLGDFLTREDALAYKEELIKLLPELQSSTYVVPDKVTVRSQK